MKHLLEDLDIIEKRIKAQRIALFLDYDGTLTPIVETPDKALLQSSVRELLQQLSKIPEIQLTIISGRALNDVRALVDVEGIGYVGNHGYEMMVPGVESDPLASSAYNDLLERLKMVINEKLAQFPGSFLEDKGITISVHFRLINPDQAVVLEQLLYRMVQPYFDNGELRFNMGKKVFEIKPPLDWDKGKAVLWILEKQQSLPIYLGDDTTDEDAFTVLKDAGITVYVGSQYRQLTSAKYYLNNPAEVAKFLEYLREVKRNEKTGKS